MSYSLLLALLSLRLCSPFPIVWQQQWMVLLWQRFSFLFLKLTDWLTGWMNKAFKKWVLLLPLLSVDEWGDNEDCNDGDVMMIMMDQVFITIFSALGYFSQIAGKEMKDSISITLVQVYNCAHHKRKEWVHFAEIIIVPCLCPALCSLTPIMRVLLFVGFCNEKY